MDDKNQLIRNINSALAYLKMNIAELRDCHGIKAHVVTFDRNAQQIHAAEVNFSIIFSGPVV